MFEVILTSCAGPHLSAGAVDVGRGGKQVSVFMEHWVGSTLQIQCQQKPNVLVFLFATRPERIYFV